MVGVLKHFRPVNRLRFRLRARSVCELPRGKSVRHLCKAVRGDVQAAGEFRWNAPRFSRGAGDCLIELREGCGADLFVGDELRAAERCFLIDNESAIEREPDEAERHALHEVAECHQLLRFVRRAGRDLNHDSAADRCEPIVYRAERRIGLFVGIARQATIVCRRAVLEGETRLLAVESHPEISE